MAHEQHRASPQQGYGRPGDVGQRDDNVAAGKKVDAQHQQQGYVISHSM